MTFFKTKFKDNDFEWKNEEALNLFLQNTPETKINQKLLGDLFHNCTNEKDSELIVKKILTLLKDSKCDQNVFLKGISRHIKNPLSPIYEHAIILTASIFKDSSFNFSTFKHLEKFRSLMPKECFIETSKVKLKTSFDDKKKIITNSLFFTFKSPINYLQEGIQIIKDEVHQRLEEVFNKLPFLIKNASQRIITFKSKEYFYTILNYDGYDLLKDEVLYLLVERSFYILIQEVFNLLFSNKICLRFKICLTGVIVKIIEREKNIKKINLILLELSDRINKYDGRLNEYLLYNFKYIFELCKVIDYV